MLRKRVSQLDLNLLGHFFGSFWDTNGLIYQEKASVAISGRLFRRITGLSGSHNTQMLKSLIKMVLRPISISNQ